MTPEQLDSIEARANAAADGPWERGDVWQWAGVMPEMFGEGRCGFCNHCGKPVWVGEADINGEQMLAHKHRDPNPYDTDHVISNAGGLIAGNFDYEEGGVIEAADIEFIVHARTDVPALVAEVRRLRSTVEQIRELVLPSADQAEDEDLYGLVVDIRRLVYEHDSTISEDKETAA